jgi:hypothetical protein
MQSVHSIPSFTRLNMTTKRIATLALTLAFGSLIACAVDEEASEPWIGEERGALELIPDETPSFVDEAELQDVMGDEALDEFVAEPDVQEDGWTGWYDRDNPSGNGDWELRSLQAGVCSSPTGVECRTITGLALWQTGEVVSCSAIDGLLCLNSSQPDGVCNYDYKVRFLCPSCVPATCAPGQCGHVPNGCEDGTIWCGICAPPPPPPLLCPWGVCDNGDCCENNFQCANNMCNLY